MENTEIDLLDGLTKDQWAEKIKWRTGESYVFVSYASLEWKSVYPTVVNLQNMGFNIYIDTEFKEEANTGWLDKMNKSMSDYKCKGIITFISMHSLRSYAVLIEQLFSHYDDVIDNFDEKKIPNFYISMGANSPQELRKEMFSKINESGAMDVRTQLVEGTTIKKYLEYYMYRTHRNEFDIKKALEKIEKMNNKHKVAIMMYELFIDNANLITFGDPDKCSKLLEKNFVGEKNTTISFRPNEDYIVHVNPTVDVNKNITIESSKPIEVGSNTSVNIIPETKNSDGWKGNIKENIEVEKTTVEKTEVTALEAAKDTAFTKEIDLAKDMKIDLTKGIEIDLAKDIEIDLTKELEVDWVRWKNKLPNVKEYSFTIKLLDQSENGKNWKDVWKKVLELIGSQEDYQKILNTYRVKIANSGEKHPLKTFFCGQSSKEKTFTLPYVIKSMDIIVESYWNSENMCKEIKKVMNLLAIDYNELKIYGKFEIDSQSIDNVKVKDYEKVESIEKEELIEKEVCIEKEEAGKKDGKLATSSKENVDKPYGSNSGLFTYKLYGKEYVKNQSDFMYAVFEAIVPKHVDKLTILDKELTSFSITDYSIVAKAERPTYFRGCYTFLAGGKKVCVGASYGIGDKMRQIDKMLKICGEDQSILEVLGDSSESIKKEKFNIVKKVENNIIKKDEDNIVKKDEDNIVNKDENNMVNKDENNIVKKGENNIDKKDVNSIVKEEEKNSEKGDANFICLGKKYSGYAYSDLMAKVIEQLFLTYPDKIEKVINMMGNIVTDKKPEPISYYIKNKTIKVQKVTYYIGTHSSTSVKLRQIMNIMNVMDVNVGKETLTINGKSLEEIKNS